MLRFSTAGESHGECLIALISGLPAGLDVDLEFIDRELWRRQQGFGRGGRMHIEQDRAHILSGVRHGRPLVRRFPSKLKIETGKIGPRFCPWLWAIRQSTKQWLRRGRATLTLPVL